MRRWPSCARTSARNCSRPRSSMPTVSLATLLVARRPPHRASRPTCAARIAIAAARSSAPCGTRRGSAALFSPCCSGGDGASVARGGGRAAAGTAGRAACVRRDFVPVWWRGIHHGEGGPGVPKRGWRAGSGRTEDPPCPPQSLVRCHRAVGTTCRGDGADGCIGSHRGRKDGRHVQHLGCWRRLTGLSTV
jgi:hypothetical protein